MLVFVGVEELPRQVARCANAVLHAGDADANALAVFIAAIQLRGVCAAIAGAGAIAVALGQRRRKLRRPLVQTIKIFGDRARNFR